MGKAETGAEGGPWREAAAEAHDASDAVCLGPMCWMEPLTGYACCPLCGGKVHAAPCRGGSLDQGFYCACLVLRHVARVPGVASALVATMPARVFGSCGGPPAASCLAAPVQPTPSLWALISFQKKGMFA